MQDITALSFLYSIPAILPLLFLIAIIILFLRLRFFSWFIMLPYRIVAIFLRLLGIVRPRGNWSVVYDAKTKEPLDPAYVTVRDAAGTTVFTAITDIDGRFALILPRGTYTIESQKTNYVFPSILLRGQASDGKYGAIYSGAFISVIDSERSVAVAIPMDPVGDDWNQKQKRHKGLFSHYREESYVMAQYVYFIVGALMAIDRYFLISKIDSKNILTAYGVLLGLNILWRGIQPHHYTHSLVLDKKTHAPVTFARITVFTKKGKQFARSTTSYEGEFVCLVPRGRYYVTIEKRDNKGVYTLVYTSGTFLVTRGYIGKKFTV